MDIHKNVYEAAAKRLYERINGKGTWDALSDEDKYAWSLHVEDVIDAFCDFGYEFENPHTYVY